MSDWASLRSAIAGGVLLLCGAAAPMQGGPAKLPALGGIERGEWVLRGADGSSRRMCLTDPGALIQLEHRGVQCTQYVVESRGDAGTIRYTCPGHGHGRTTVTVETPRLVRLETQGLVDGAPFAFEFEGRKTGACAGAR